MTHKLGCFGLCQGSECACIIPESWHKLTDTSLKAVFSGSHVLLHDCCWVKGDLKISWPRQCWASLPWQVWWGLTSSLPPAVKAETEQEIMSNTKSKIDLKSSKTRSPNVATSSLYCPKCCLVLYCLFLNRLQYKVLYNSIHTLH